MEIFKNFKKNLNSIALIDEKIGNFKYKDLINQMGVTKDRIKNNSVVLLIADNSAHFVLGYVSFLSCKNVINILLDISFSEDFIKDVISKYKPNYVFSPNGNFHFKNEYKEILNLYSYSIFEINKNVNKNLNFDNFLLLSTSGTTQSPKFVRLSKKNINDNTKKICQSLKIKKNHTTITTMPLGYSYGLSILNTHLFKCAKIVMNNNTVIEKIFWRKIKDYKIDSFGGVPEFFEILKKINFEKFYLNSIKYITQAGGRLDENLLKYFGKICKKKSIKFYVMYGQTEAGPRMSVLNWRMFYKKLNSVGHPLKNYKVKIICKKNKIKTKKKGEIVFYGDNVCLGYAKNSNDLKKGDINKKKLFTGDIGYQDKDKYLYIVGRKKKFIKFFGKRLDLKQIEDFLYLKGFKVRCLVADKFLKLNLYNKQSLESEIKLNLKEQFDINQNFIIINKKFTKTFKDFKYE
jgi:long-chain acyl-CoA synthetase